MTEVSSPAPITAIQVDAVEFYKERIQALADAITKGSQHLLSDPEANLPAAFVTFKTRTAQVLHLSLGPIYLSAVLDRPPRSNPSKRPMTVRRLG